VPAAFDAWKRSRAVFLATAGGWVENCLSISVE
jgi:hypothetical protein